VWIVTIVGPVYVGPTRVVCVVVVVVVVTAAMLAAHDRASTGSRMANFFIADLLVGCLVDSTRAG
jgi:hypothetical protein